MFKDEGGCFMKVKIVSGRSIPGCVSGVIPAANIICAIKQQKFHCPSVVSHNPIWNYVAEFKGTNLKKDSITFTIRDADQILSSIQVPVKDIPNGVINTHFVEMLDMQSPCSISFTIQTETKSTLTKKRLLERTKKFKDTVLSRLGSDPDLASPKHSFATIADDNLEQKSKSLNNRGIRRCHSYVNERTRKNALSRHQYVNCSKERSCGEVGTNKENQITNAATKKKLLVLIQGRNLGTSQSDIVSVFVGGVDCTDNIQHYSTEKLLVRVPRGSPLSPVSVVTKSGGVGQQNAKVKVTYENSSSSDELKSLRRSETLSNDSGVSIEAQVRESASSPTLQTSRLSDSCASSPTLQTPRLSDSCSCSPTLKTSRVFNRVRNANRKGAKCCGTSSDSGSDGLCVNSRSPLRSSLPPQRRRSSSSYSSDKSSLEPDSSSSVFRETQSTHSDRPTSSSVFRDTPPVPSVRPNSKFLAPSGNIEIVSPNASTGIIAPPQHFAEGFLNNGNGIDNVEDSLYDLTKTELIREILKLRKTVSNLAMTVHNLSGSS